MAARLFAVVYYPCLQKGNQDPVLHLDSPMLWGDAMKVAAQICGNGWAVTVYDTVTRRKVRGTAGAPEATLVLA